MASDQGTHPDTAWMKADSSCVAGIFPGAEATELGTPGVGGGGVESFLSHGMDSNANHMTNAGYYNPRSVGPMSNYRMTQGE